MQVRPVSVPNDIQALDELFSVISKHDGHAPIGEHKYLDLLYADDQSPTGLIGTAGSDIVAYVAVRPTRERGTWAMEVAAHPDHRSPSDLLGLIEAGTGRIRAAGGRALRVWAFEAGVVSALMTAGFVVERELRQLRRPLPVDRHPVFPSGVDIHGFRPGVDDRRWIEVNNAAFAGHPENGAWTQDVLDDRKRQSWFDAQGFRMAWLGDELVGFCWTKLHGTDLGEIYSIAVSPARRGRGLGRALTLEGLRYLFEAWRASAAMLYVDSDNRRAIALYTELGFRLHHVDLSLVLTM